MTIFIIILIILLILLVVYNKWFKNIHCDNVMMFTGGVKCGKTSLTLAKSLQIYNKIHRAWRIKKIIKPYKKWEEPLFYSNIPLANVKYSPITNEILERKVRIPHGSCCFISEASLVADSMTAIGKQDEVKILNEEINLFAKLYAHYSHGGYLFIETQNINDNHYGIKRAINKFIWIERCIKWIPFILIYKVREMAYSEDNSIHNNFNEDIEETTKYTLCFKSVWNKYDRFNMSYFTDDLDIYGINESIYLKQKIFRKRKDLRCRKIPSFRKFLTIGEDYIYRNKEGLKNEKTK